MWLAWMGGASSCGGGAKTESRRGLRLVGRGLFMWEGLPRVEVGLKCREGVDSFGGGVASSGGRGFHVWRRG